MDKKKPTRTPVVTEVATERKRKKGVAKSPPPDEVVLEPVIDRSASQTASCKMRSLRHLASLLYITDHRGLSTKQISEHEQFVGNVGVRTIGQWCTDDNWVQKRADYFKTIDDGIKKGLGKRLVEIQTRQLKELDNLFVKMLEKIEGTKPGSTEGMVGALVKLVSISNELREKVAKEIVPARLDGAQDEGMQVTPKLTESEARAAAMAIIHERRAKMRATSSDDTDDEKPQLRVVEGGASGEAVD